MAKIISSSPQRVLKISEWRGINQNPDGDSKLAIGEAAEMRNFRITRDGNLQVRPGTKTVLKFDSPIRGMWHGIVNQREVTVCACEGKLWELDLAEKEKTEIGELEDGETHFFAFSKKLYILNGCEYMVWDGENDAVAVEGYIPVVSVSNAPSGGGVMLQQVNKLTPKRRARFSPDGSARAFKLPESRIAEVCSVMDLAADEELSFTFNPDNSTVTISPAPANNINSIEITWAVKKDDRKTVTSMLYSEFYSGRTDAHVFLYGDNSNKAIYSGLDYDGQPSAEYFPDLNVIHAGTANTPITSMIRHYSRLLIYKLDSTYIVSYGTEGMSDGSVASAFYITPINRAVGNCAPGQVRLVDNNPLTLYESSVYQWISGDSVSYDDQRNARRISGRIRESLSAMELHKAYTFDDSVNHEYYICEGDVALVMNYNEDVWYIYENFPARQMMLVKGELYFGNEHGEIRHVSRQHRSDDLQPIDTFWRSGSLAFNKEWMRKYSMALYVSIKPENGARMKATVRSSKKSIYPDLEIASGLINFKNISFNHWSFSSNRQPQVKKLKLKVKKTPYYQLIFHNCETSSTATILSADIMVKYTGKVK